MMRLMTVIGLWLGRLVFLTLLVLVWLAFAGLEENRRSADESKNDLRTRGKKTVAKTDSTQVEIPGRPRTYYYVVEEKRWLGRSHSKKPLDGQTVTYLPEEPARHELGSLEPEPWSLMAVLAVLVLAVVYGMLSFVFFLACFSTPGRCGRLTPLGTEITVALIVVKFAVVFATLSLAKPTFEAVLDLYVPAFVAGTVATVLGVRIFAWTQGLALTRPAEDLPGVSPSPGLAFGVQAGATMSGWWS